MVILTEELLKAVSDERVVESDAIHHCSQAVDTALYNLHTTPLHHSVTLS